MSKNFFLKTIFKKKKALSVLLVHILVNLYLIIMVNILMSIFPNFI